MCGVVSESSIDVHCWGGTGDAKGEKRYIDVGKGGRTRHCYIYLFWHWYIQEVPSKYKIHRFYHNERCKGRKIDIDVGEEEEHGVAMSFVTIDEGEVVYSRGTERVLR